MESNPISQLLEWCQKQRKSPPDFECSMHGPSHVPTFSGIVKAPWTNQQGFGSSTRNKQEAKKNAYQDFMDKLKLLGEKPEAGPLKATIAMPTSVPIPDCPLSQAPRKASLKYYDLLLPRKSANLKRDKVSKLPDDVDSKPAEATPLRNFDEATMFFKRLMSAQLPNLSLVTKGILAKKGRKMHLMEAIEELHKEVGSEHTIFLKTDEELGQVCIVELKYKGVTIAFNRGFHKTDASLAEKVAIIATINFLLVNRMPDVWDKFQ